MLPVRRVGYPGYAPYECPADEVHVVGKVLWKVTRA